MSSFASGLMGGDLRSGGTRPLRVREMGFNLLATRTAGLEILLRVPLDFGLIALPALDLIAERTKSHGELGAVHGGAELLRFVELPRLQGPHRAIRGLGEVEEDDVRVELGGGVAIHRPRTVVLDPMLRAVADIAWDMPQGHAETVGNVLRGLPSVDDSAGVPMFAPAPG